MRVAGLIAILIATTANAEVSNSICRATGKEICSKTFYGGGTCSGLDQLPILEEPWESRPIKITGVAITIDVVRKPRWYERLRGITPRFYAFAGNSASPDVMTMLSSAGTTPSPHYQDGQFFSFPGKTGNEDPHVDLHVQCTPVGVVYNSYMTIFYKFD